MKKIIFLLILLLMTLNLSPQQEQYEVTVINVAIPIRVFDGNKFIDNLTIQDFEVHEDGKPQKIQAIYLTKKNQIERSEGTRDFMPLLSRNFFLLFQLSDYNPKLGEAIDYLFTSVLLPGDILEIMTPLKNYTLSAQALKSKPKETLAKELQGLVRKDTKVGASEYRTLMSDLKRLVRGMSGSGGITSLESDYTTDSFGLQLLLPRYRETLRKLEDLRIVDEKKLLRFAAQLKRREGQKNVFFFYQREFRPEIAPRIMNQLMAMYQDQPSILGDLMDLMQFYSRDPKWNINNIKQAFADSSIFFNFIYMHKEPENVSGIRMTEQSEDIFETFSQVAEATGGIIDSSQNPAASFKNGTKISESYYILYYSPEKYIKDGKYKSIEVKVKNKDYKITHRQGYFAR